MLKFSVLSWNIGGLGYSWYYPAINFKNTIPFLNKYTTDIICLQEVPSAGKKLSLLNNIHRYGIALPKENKNFSGNYNHNVILSQFPIVKSGEIELCNIKEQKLEKVLWSDIIIKKYKVRIYNCHLPIFGLGMVDRIKCLETILKDSKQFKGPIIVCGDGNTTIPADGLSRKFIKWFYKIPIESMYFNGKYFEKDERFIFAKKAEEKGFKEIGDITKNTWVLPHTRWELFKLKLDWFFVKNLEAQEFVLDCFISDHKPLLAKCFLKNYAKTK